MIYRKSTKELLAESILELSKAKSIDKITIREIVENCGMTSGTFYNHFKDKYDLIAWIYLYQIEKMASDYVKSDSDWEQSLVEVLKMVNTERKFYKNALKNTSGQNSFFNATYLRSIELMKEIILEKKKAPLTKEELFYVDFYMKGFGYSAVEWIVNELDYTEEELAAYLTQAIPEKLRKYLLNKSEN